MRFFWKQRNKKTCDIMELEVENTTDVVNLLLDRMEKFGINYKISKQNNNPKTGHLPPTDIDSVEKAITDMEQKIGSSIEPVEIEYLMDLYSKVNIIFIIINRLWNFILLPIILNLNIIKTRFIYRLLD